jgi:predicted GIY-YIG superfamily endonuclease
VELVWYAEVPTFIEAWAYEHQIKGWTRAKKEALIQGNIELLHNILKAERKSREKKQTRP